MSGTTPSTDLFAQYSSQSNSSISPNSLLKNASREAYEFREESTFDYEYLIGKFGCQKTLGSWIRRYIEEHGFLRLQNVEAGCSQEVVKLFLIELCSFVGNLASHNPGKKDFVWEIKSKPSTSSLKTFSEHNQDAPLHTDSQYREEPERFMILMTLRQARCGGGYTEVVDFKQVLQGLRSTVLGSEIVDFFSHQSLPIAIPSIFQTDFKSPYISSKLISGKPLIRYRYDTLKAGLSLMKPDQVEIFHDKLNLFDRLIQSSPHRVRFLSSPNEIVFLDNHRFLHGRSSFIDLNRLLLRIRIN